MPTGLGGRRTPRASRRNVIAFAACLAAGLAAAAPGGAGAATVLGSDLSGSPDASCAGCALVQFEARPGGGPLAAPFRAVIVEVRIESLGADSGVLQVVDVGPERFEGGGARVRDVTVRASTPIALVAGLNVLSVNLPVEAGQRVGVRLQNGAVYDSGSVEPPAMGRAFDGPDAVGESAPFLHTGGAELLVQAAIEPDNDGDGSHDGVDPDDDGDGRPDASDNCATVSNPDQSNVDDDQFGDVCDTDDDNDGRADGVDNCATVTNPGQENLDGDGLGDACDPDADGDDVPDFVDNCDGLANPGQQDSDLDGIGDACEADDDDDGLSDGDDNCPTVANSGQDDLDGDRQGDACDADDDGDGLADATDNCPRAPNPDQGDNDADDLGDVCDHDDDNDGHPDETDLCDTTPNEGNTDVDGDGLGDACDPRDDRPCPLKSPTGPVSRPVWGLGGTLGGSLGSTVKQTSCTVAGLGL